MPKPKTALNRAKSLISSEKQPAKILEKPEKPNSGGIAAVLMKLSSLFKIKKSDKDVAEEDTQEKPAWPLSFFKRKGADETDAEKNSSEAIAEAKDKKYHFTFSSFFRKKEKKEGIIEKFKQEEKDKVKKRAVIQERRHKIREHLERAGLVIEPGNLSKKIFTLCILINLAISAFLIYHFSITYGITWATILASVAALWILVFAVILFISWVLFYIAVDLKIFKRKVDIEEVLPDYLQLTAANIKAGMTIDRALWYAVRPRFGVLANEIETVAKETMRGEDLKTALKKFADKFDSLLLKRCISLLIEGIEAGGEIGTLLNKIAINIDENRIMRQEMEANVTTYAIFISFATIAAAPVLFALSGVLIKVIANLSTSLSGITTSSSAAGFGLTFSGTGIAYKDFKIFAIVSLIITSFFSSVIIATIKKGNAKLGFKYIPLFIVITITLFLITDNLMGKMLGVFL
ncbi:MAG: type II secretion system F family protein [Nanoarchaeota archaeon]